MTNPTNGQSATEAKFEIFEEASVAELARRLQIAGPDATLERRTRSSDGHSVLRVVARGGSCVTAAGEIVAPEEYPAADDINDSIFCPPICRKDPA